MTTDDARPPPLVQPPPAPPPEAMLAHAQRTLRGPALFLMGSATLNAVMMGLIALGTAGGAIAVVASGTGAGTSGGPEVMIAVVLGIIALIHVVLILAEATVGYGALRMLRTQGYGWALTGPIVHMTVSIVHATAIFMLLSLFACLVSPIEVGLALASGILAIVRLLDPRVKQAFAAVEADPSLLDALRDGEY